jgi:hypothetical protein
MDLRPRPIPPKKRKPGLNFAGWSRCLFSASSKDARLPSTGKRARAQIPGAVQGAVSEFYKAFQL